MKVNFKISLLADVDKDGKDMMAVLVDRLDPCPGDCDTSSPLNN